MRQLIVLCTIAGLALAPSAALAQQPAAVTSAAAAPAPAAPAPVAPAAPVSAQLTLTLERVGGKLATVLVGDRVRIRGSVETFVSGQKVRVRFFSAGKKMGAKTKTIQPGPGGSGVFELSYRPPRSGSLVVRATHDATAELAMTRVISRKIDVIPRSVGHHARKRAIIALQRRLHRLGYVTGAKGHFDARTARAVLTFRKVTGMARTTEASIDVMRRIALGKGEFKIRRPDHGRHAEADLTRQVLALIEGGKVRRIYPISSGKPSTPTVLGSFRVYSKTPGTNAKGMVDSAYFIRGYATHGYPSVPIYPASHGCLRLPIPDARTVFNWMRIGTPVDVYYGPRPK
jgi:peptidoglycan hydrolase-like protein with peptidoglycan-binding domain